MRMVLFSVCATLCLLMFAMPSNPQDSLPAAQAAGASNSGKFAELSDQFMKESLALSPSGASPGWLPPTCGPENRQDN